MGSSRCYSFLTLFSFPVFCIVVIVAFVVIIFAACFMTVVFNFVVMFF